jgi:hypothetical protein
MEKIKIDTKNLQKNKQESDGNMSKINGEKYMEKEKIGKIKEKEKRKMVGRLPKKH